MMNRKLRMGMVGGGKDAFIGAIHRLAAFMDGQIELVCGCFSINPEISVESGKSYFLPENRVYKTFKEMFKNEAELPEGERMDFVVIVTPNFVHFGPAMMALENGFHVVIDKPISFSLEEALQLKKKLIETGLLLALTHVYSGYPAIKEARERIKSGDFGQITKVYTEYLQGWLATKIDGTDNSLSTWKTDPKFVGKSGCMGDIGTHAHHLVEYVTGLKTVKLLSSLNRTVQGRMVDDDGVVILEFENKVTGVLMASQVAAGEENALKIRVFGEKGGLEWSQQEPNTLILKWKDKPMELIRVGLPYMLTSAKSNTRTPGGHPEGYLEAFANIYKNFSQTLRAHLSGEEPTSCFCDFPSVEEGIRGMQFIDAVVKSSVGSEWVAFGK